MLGFLHFVRHVILVDGLVVALEGSDLIVAGLELGLPFEDAGRVCDEVVVVLGLAGKGDVDSEGIPI